MDGTSGSGVAIYNALNTFTIFDVWYYSALAAGGLRVADWVEDDCVNRGNAAVDASPPSAAARKRPKTAPRRFKN